MKKLAIVITHPIQYYAPWFALLAARGTVRPKVFHTWSQARERVLDAGFGKSLAWDIPLLDGYEHEFVENRSPRPSDQHFRGIDNPDLIARIEAFEPDFLLVFGWNFKSHLKAMRHFKGRIPVGFRGDSTLLDERPGPRCWLRRLALRWVYRHIDMAFAVGQSSRAYFAAHGLGPGRIRLAPHAIDNARFGTLDGAARAELAGWRQSLNPDGRRVFLFVGKFEPKKDPLLLARAAALMPGCLFVMVGDGVLRPELEALAAASENLRLLPFQNQSRMPLVYRLGDCLCLPSAGPGETWGLAANEAMACGLPVLLSDKVGGHPDLVAEGRTGRTFRAGSLEALLEALVALRGADLERMGRQAREHVQAFSFGAICQALEDWCQGR